MRADKRCLILAAGFGTRMGHIGTQLPKVLWPVFGMSLLEVQLRFARSLGYDEVWINLHHQADLILAQTRLHPVFKDVRWIREEPAILDIGGAIHNLASHPEVNYQGELLVLNADQFLWFNAEDLLAWKKQCSDLEVLLLNWKVSSSQGYNQVLSDEDRCFLRVVQNAELERNRFIETYSGNSVIRLESLRRVTGPSSFFTSVCNPQERACRTALVSSSYWDFGTAKRYTESLRGLLSIAAKHGADPFLKFLTAEGALEVERLRASIRAYGCDVPGLINLTDSDPPSSHPEGVVIEAPFADGHREGVHLVYRGVVQAVS
jgi:hypothetical protein